MTSYFSSKFFKDNRLELRHKFKDDAPIIITANGLLQRGGDSTYAFSQDANFWYLTGINEPDILLIMSKDEEFLILPSRSGVRESFDGVIGVDELLQRSGVDKVYDEKTGWLQIAKALSKNTRVATISPPPPYVEQYGFYTNPARTRLKEHLYELKPGIETIDIGQHLARMRMIKQPSEINAIQSAIDITIASLQDATNPNELNKYSYEYELEAKIVQGFRHRGATSESFESIVASGKRACTLHNVNNSGKINKKDFILTDIGAEVEHYAADITRVFCKSKPTERQLEVYNAVLKVQQYAASQLNVGTTLKEYETKVENYMGQKLIELKLIKTNNHNEVRKFYPHSTSHFLGLNVHDIGDYNSPLQAGVVLTVEPGIYIPDENIGVRLEDDALITKTGVKILSDKLSKKLV